MIPKPHYGKIWNQERQDIGAGERPLPLWDCGPLGVL